KFVIMLSCNQDTEVETNAMSLRVKTLFIIGVVLVSLVVALYVITQTVLVRSFSQLEEQNAREHVQRALNALQDQMTALSTTVFDYSFWDDTYTFMEDHNQEYIDANLQNSFLVNLGMNLAAYIGTDGEQVFVRSIDLEKGDETPLPEGLLPYLSTGSPFLEHTDLTGAVQGIVLV